MIAIDPGLRGCGVAVFEDKTLVKAAYIKNKAVTDDGPPVWLKMAQAVVAWTSHPSCSEVVIERQRLRPGKEKGNPQNMMELQGVVGAITGICYDDYITAYFPETWKGTVKKEVMTERILNHLSPEELLIIGKLDSKSHNTIDAVGIGLFHLGRLRHEYTTPRS